MTTRKVTTGDILLKGAACDARSRVYQKYKNPREVYDLIMRSFRRKVKNTRESYVEHDNSLCADIWWLYATVYGADLHNVKLALSSKHHIGDDLYCTGQGACTYAGHYYPDYTLMADFLTWPIVKEMLIDNYDKLKSWHSYPTY